MSKSISNEAITARQNDYRIDAHWLTKSFRHLSRQGAKKITFPPKRSRRTDRWTFKIIGQLIY